MEILLVLRTILAYIAVLLPGLAFWAWFHNDEDDPAQSLAQILGISFSVIALGALVFHHISLRVNGWILGGISWQFAWSWLFLASSKPNQNLFGGIGSSWRAF